MRKPDFFIVGAPRCGTTAMYAYLKQHPEIYMPDIKEPHFFGSDLVWLRYTPPSLEEYISLFSNAAPHQKIGEASVYYLYSQKASFEIKEFSPNAKIIIMLRNPIDMMYSLHSQLVYSLQEDITDFQEALNAEKDRKRGKRIPLQCHCLQYLFYKDVAKFYEQVKRYFDVFGRDNVHVIIYDDFSKDLLGVYQTTLRFLEVDEHFRPDVRVVNANKVARSRKLMQWMASSVVTYVARKSIPRAIRRRVASAIVRLNTKYVPRSPLPPLVRKELAKEFYDEVERLSELLGRDLTFWVQSEGGVPHEK